MDNKVNEEKENKLSEKETSVANNDESKTNDKTGWWS